MPTRDLIDVPVRTPADLTDRWSALLGSPAFRDFALWLGWVDARGIMPPLLVPVEKPPPVPDERLLEGVVNIHRFVRERIGEGSHLAMALRRPGEAVPTADDERWSDALVSYLPSRIEQTWSLHLAAGGEVGPLVDPPWPRSS